MKRGFPRPTTIVEYSYRGEAVQGRRFPMPYTAHDLQISAADESRECECVWEKKCFVCGEDVEEVWMILQNNERTMESGPFHEKCARLTLATCPHFTMPLGRGRRYSLERGDAADMRKLYAERGWFVGEKEARG